MRRLDTRCLIAVLSTPLLLAPTRAVAQQDAPAEPAVWLESGPELAPGQPARLGYDLSTGGYLTILRATTDGDLSVIYPQRPNSRSSHAVRGTLPMRGDAAPGVGYLFWVASPAPFDFRQYSARDGEWATGAVGRRGGDPFEQVDRFARGATRGRYTVGFSRYRVGALGRAGERRAPAVHGSGYDGGYGTYPDGAYPGDGYSSGAYGYGGYSGYWGGPEWNGYWRDTWRYRRSWRDREYERAYDRAAYNDPRSRYLRHCADGTLAPYTTPCSAVSQPQRPGPGPRRRP